MRKSIIFLLLLLLALPSWAESRKWVVVKDELVTYATVNYTEPIDTLWRGCVIKENKELRGHISYLNNGHRAFAPMEGLEEWDGKDSLADGTPIVLITGARPPMSVNEHKDATKIDPMNKVVTKVVAYVLAVLGWILVISGLLSLKKKSKLEKEIAKASYWYGCLLKLAAGYILVSMTAGLMTLSMLWGEGKKITPDGIISIIQLAVLQLIAIILAVKWCFKWRKEVLATMLWNNKISNASIRWFFILVNGVICFYFMMTILGPIGLLVGLGLFIYMMLPVRNHLHMRCPQCYGYWDSVVYQGRKIDGVKAVNHKDISTSEDRRISGDDLEITKTTTRTNRTDNYLMYREDYHCLECGHHWHRRYKGPCIGTDVERKKDIESKRISLN